MHQTRSIMSRLWFFIVLVALSVSLPARAEAPFKYETTFGNLPKDVRPVAYRIDLDLVPDPTKLSSADGKGDLPFKGRVEVDIDVLNAVDTITFNRVDLTLASVSLDGQAATRDKQDNKS